VSHGGPSRILRQLADAYQAEVVIPHCHSCRRPCCRLETLVLELDWRRLKGLWELTISRGEFDRTLEAGKGPPEVRANGGLYYAHGRTCPAFDEGSGLCRVYGGPLQPLGCRTFPVYEDRGGLVADLRCEALDAEALAGRVRAALGGEFAVAARPDPEFPFLVSLLCRRRPAGRTGGAGRRRPRPKR
jgi:Fe-S-cluster containining protein